MDIRVILDKRQIVASEEDPFALVAILAERIWRTDPQLHNLEFPFGYEVVQENEDVRRHVPMVRADNGELRSYRLRPGTEWRILWVDEFDTVTGTEPWDKSLLGTKVGEEWPS